MENQKVTDLGTISIHPDVMESVTITDFYHALRRHELGEPQRDIPSCLIEDGKIDSLKSGLIVSYHVTREFLVFGVVTHPEFGETRVKLAPLGDLLNGGLDLGDAVTE